MLKASTVEDVRLNAAACELARCVHAMRCAAYPEMPSCEWMDLSDNDKTMYVEHSAVLLWRLAPVVTSEAPKLKVVK